jgi:hypothetical protein
MLDKPKTHITLKKPKGRNEPDPNAITRQPEWWRRYHVYRSRFVREQMVQLEYESRLAKRARGVAVGQREYL